MVGYRLYVRTADSSYGQGDDVGLPSPDAGGTLSSLVESLNVRGDYFFGVTALAADQTESDLSNEMMLGYTQVAGFVDSDGDGLSDAEEDQNLNKLVDPGETDPGNPDTDGDGVGDQGDQCEGTAGWAAVNAVGCSCAQVVCDNGNACDGVEGCTAGVCRPGTPLGCNDGNVCTSDGCSPLSGCTNTPIPGCGSCSSHADCDDGNVCTTDSCDSVNGCRNTPTPNATPCSDGVFCNGLETCRGGVCSAGSPPECDDASACTTDACDEALGRCAHTSTGDCCMADADCADNDLCTVNERCENGVCKSEAMICPDGDECTQATCDPAFGCGTEVLPDGTECEDGDPCTEGEVCVAGGCRAPSAQVDGGETLSVRKLKLRQGPNRHRLYGRGVIEKAGDMDPAASGAVLELLDAAGVPLYQAEVLGEAFNAKRSRRGFEFTRKATQWSLELLNGLKVLDFERKGQRMKVEAEAASSDLDDAFAAPSLRWVIRSGETCARSPLLSCSSESGRERRCR